MESDIQKCKVYLVSFCFNSLVLWLLLRPAGTRFNMTFFSLARFVLKAEDTETKAKSAIKTIELFSDVSHQIFFLIFNLIT